MTSMPTPLNQSYRDRVRNAVFLAIVEVSLCETPNLGSRTAVLLSGEIIDALTTVMAQILATMPSVAKPSDLRSYCDALAKRLRQRTKSLSCWKPSPRRSQVSSIRASSRAPGAVLPRMSAVPGAMASSWRPSRIPGTSVTRNCSNGAAATSTRSNSISTKSIVASHRLRHARTPAATPRSEPPAESIGGPHRTRTFQSGPGRKPNRGSALP